MEAERNRSFARRLPPDLRIYPSGDSITHGGGSGGYRRVLGPLLDAVAPGFCFVGDSTDGSAHLPDPHRRHGGHSSYSTRDIECNLDGLCVETFAEHGGSERDPHGGRWLTGLPDEVTYEVPGRGSFTYGPRPLESPDVVLLLVGTNDLFRLGWDLEAASRMPSLRTRCASLLDAFHRMLPAAPIFAALLPPFNNSPTSDENGRIGRFNTMVSDLVAGDGQQYPGRRIVDLNTGYTGGFVDDLHPTEEGYAWIAQQWYDALISTLGENVGQPAGPETGR